VAGCENYLDDGYEGVQAGGDQPGGGGDDGRVQSTDYPSEMSFALHYHEFHRAGTDLRRCM